jgi:endoglucanase
MLSADTPPPPPAPSAALVQDSRIRLNTIGFLPDAPKQATIGARCSEARVVRLSDGTVIYTAKASQPVRTKASDTNETVQTVDFSNVTEPGSYRLEVPGVGASDTFTIAQDVWVTPYQLVTRAMYLWRCGTAVETVWNGVTYRHEACHLDDGSMELITGRPDHRDGTGGWHDAGDYNKYVVNAGVSVGFMLKAWEQFRPNIEHVSVGIPESKDQIPDLLNEVRWEAEWLLKMQAEDGRVYHKLSSPDFRYWGVPEKEKDTRFFSPWSTSATADFAAMLAETSRSWREFDPAFSERCLNAAKKAWDFLEKNPKNVPADLHAFKTGEYQAKDASHRFWAAAELFEATGDVAYLKDFEKRSSAQDVSFQGPGWGDVHDLAIATYLLSQYSTQRDPKVVARLSAQWIKQARKVVSTAASNAYARPLGVDRKAWFWGCNGTVAGQTLLLHVADRLEPDPTYRRCAQNALDHLFGRNFYARSFVTGLGARAAAHPHDRRGGGWPGYLVGGGWPDGRSWEDDMKNYRVNEIAINWNTALIYALAAFVPPPANP